jgi:predicted Rossmann fold flavoprotein
MKNIAIIGAGSAGLFAAKLLSSYEDVKVTVFEKAKNPGTKLRASGGGKANILNANVKGDCYNNHRFMDAFLQRTDYQTIYNEFSRMGLRMTVDDENRVYPATLFSKTVLDVLLSNLSSRVSFRCECTVKKLVQREGKWYVNDFPEAYDNVLMASGSPANMIAANRKGIADYWKSLHLANKPFEPSLVGFKIKDYPKDLYGCRAKAEVSLYQDSTLIWKEIGEVMFKEDGVSGIVVMNLSSHYNQLKNKNLCRLSFNFLYDDDLFDVKAHLAQHHDLAGVLHPKLNKLYQRKPFDLRNFTLVIDSLYDMEFAQVCAGGISVDEVTDTFELKKYPGLYAVGEMLDIDGVCGGYNLFFAFASAYEAVKAMTHGH